MSKFFKLDEEIKCYKEINLKKGYEMLVLCNLQLAILVCSFCDNFCKLFVVSIAD